MRSRFLNDEADLIVLCTDILRACDRARFHVILDTSRLTRLDPTTSIGFCIDIVILSHELFACTCFIVLIQCDFTAQYCFISLFIYNAASMLTILLILLLLRDDSFRSVNCTTSSLAATNY